MRSIIPDYLADALFRVEPDTSGQPAQYIPELAGADPERLAAVVATIDGEVYGAGDSDAEFTIQSISKPFVYALALADRGFDTVLDKVGVEPSGEAFNEVSLEHDTGRPLNPMINAGALTVQSLIGPWNSEPAERGERVRQGLSAFAGRELTIDERVSSSEMDTAHRNLAIAHMLRSRDVLTEDPRTVVEGYVRQCAVLVTARDLAMMAATLANRGVNPLTNEQVVSGAVVRYVLSVMFTCGMYDAAGDWATQVGIPAKSGVGGGLIGALPGQVGIATFSPRLDEHGHSVRGVSLFERFSSDMGLHVMEIPSAASSVVRSNQVQDGERGATRVLRLQGGIRFAGAERIIRDAEEIEVDEARVVFDLSLVYSLDAVARRLLLEITRRLTDGDQEVYFVDPQGILAHTDVGAAVVVDELEGAVG
ncbi:glutaminase [Microbacterium faecale]|uniref:Glutaminase n=1 Tax=Microbacterium faecale TaxID=1804630 RepID=A0A916Y8I8_9MICO|nr:glutaminase [Microbacterium faecale]GGD33532.1 glutaminase [Microbacterium faecale]